jgi:hypothetical protein
MSVGPVILLGVIVFVAGMAGGGFDAYRTRNTNLLPKAPALSNQVNPQTSPVTVSQDDLKRPGLLYSVLTGGFAALLSWALYGPLAQLNLLDVGAPAQEYAMTLAAVAGAFFVGMGGARWLSAEADKTILQTSSTLGLASNANPAAAQQLSSTESPGAALQIAAGAYAESATPAAGTVGGSTAESQEAKPEAVKPEGG